MNEFATLEHHAITKGNFIVECDLNIICNRIAVLAGHEFIASGLMPMDIYNTITIGYFGNLHKLVSIAEQNLISTYLAKDLYAEDVMAFSICGAIAWNLSKNPQIGWRGASSNALVRGIAKIDSSIEQWHEVIGDIIDCIFIKELD